MSPLVRLTLFVVAISLLVFAASHPMARQSHSLAADCARSPFSLDCGCVVSGFNAASSGLNASQMAVALKQTRNVIGVTSTERIDEEERIAMQILPSMLPFHMDLTNRCRPTGGDAVLASGDERAEIETLCARSRHILDCGCVATRYSAVASGQSPEAQQVARAALGSQLNVSVSPSIEEISPFIANQHYDVVSAFDGVTETCAATTPSAIEAYRTVGRTPAPTMAARADASPRESQRMWCEAVDGDSPALCACRVQVLSDLVSERSFRFNGESMKALALVELGRLEPTERFNHAGRAMGATPEQTRSLYNETASELDGAHQVAREVCTAVERRVAGR